MHQEKATEPSGIRGRRWLCTADTRPLVSQPLLCACAPGRARASGPHLLSRPALAPPSCEPGTTPSKQGRRSLTPAALPPWLPASLSPPGTREIGDRLFHGTDHTGQVLRYHPPSEGTRRPCATTVTAARGSIVDSTTAPQQQPSGAHPPCAAPLGRGRADPIPGIRSSMWPLESGRDDSRKQHPAPYIAAAPNRPRAPFHHRCPGHRDPGRERAPPPASMPPTRSGWPPAPTCATAWWR